MKSLYPQSWTIGTWKLWFSSGWFSGSMKFHEVQLLRRKPSPTNNVADSSPIHLRKQSRHGSYGSQYWWNQGLAAWFRAKSTTLTNQWLWWVSPPIQTMWPSIGGHRRLCTSLESAESMASTGGPSVWSHEAKCHRVEMYSNMYIFLSNMKRVGLCHEMQIITILFTFQRPWRSLCRCHHLDDSS